MSLSPPFWTSLPLGPGVTVITSDANGLGALSKPAGVLSHPNEFVLEGRSLLTARYVPEGEYFEWPSPGGAAGAEPVRLHLLNRLDSATSGVIMVSAEPELAKFVRELFQRKHVHKIYQALVFGQPARPMELWRDWLMVKKERGKIRTGLGGGLKAETQMSVLRRRGGAQALALLKLVPRTGRSHQLRVQCAEHHLSIVGDATYGNFEANRTFTRTTGERRLFLHSLETSFDYDWQGRTHRFLAKAPLPLEFMKYV